MTKKIKGYAFVLAAFMVCYCNAITAGKCKPEEKEGSCMILKYKVSEKDTVRTYTVTNVYGYELVSENGNNRLTAVVKNKGGVIDTLLGNRKKRVEIVGTTNNIDVISYKQEERK